MKNKLRHGLVTALIMGGIFAAPMSVRAEGNISIEDTFPDTIFREYVSQSFDSDGDGWLSAEEIEAVTRIELDYSEVESLKGVEVFSNLRKIELYDCQMTSLDLSKNTKLEEIECSWGDNLTKLDVSGCTDLVKLNCSCCQLSELDVRNNTKLTSLDCGANHLTALDISKNTGLVELNIGDQTLDGRKNNIAQIDISRNTKLKDFGAYAAGLESLDVRQNTELTSMNCGVNALEALNVDNNTKLEILDCESNQLTEISVDQLKNLKILLCSDNKLTELDVSENPDLERLECEMNQLTVLDVSNNPKLEQLVCRFNQLTGLDVSDSEGLIYLECYGNSIDKINLGKNIYLSGVSKLEPEEGHYSDSKGYDSDYLRYETKNGEVKLLADTTTQFICEETEEELIEINDDTFPDDVFREYVKSHYDQNEDGKLSLLDRYIVTSINVNKGDREEVGDIEDLTGIKYFSKLEKLYCQNKLKTLDVSGLESLEKLDMEGNPLTSLNVSGCAIDQLDCYSEVLESVDASNCKALHSIYCSNGKLRKLNLAGCDILSTVFCSYNQLTELNISACPGLQKLWCESNKLKELDITGKPKLYILNCAGNSLKKLDLSACPVMEELWCYHNQISELIIENNHDFLEAYENPVDNGDGTITYDRNGLVFFVVDKDTKIVTGRECAHSWDKGKVTKAATCTAKGVITYTCTLCGETKTEAIKATGHKIVKDAAVAATTTRTGLTEGSHCSVCKKVIKKQEIIPKLTPKYSNEWVKGKWYNKDGTQTYKPTLSWKSDKKGWWVVDSKGWYPKDQWQKIDGVWYYFKADGYMASNEWCKGYWLNKNGSWTFKKQASWKKDKTGWYFGYNGWYAKNQWQKIDNKWYYFDAKGYVVTGTKKIGGKTYKFNSSGVCLNP